MSSPYPSNQTTKKRVLLSSTRSASAKIRPIRVRFPCFRRLPLPPRHHPPGNWSPRRVSLSARNQVDRNRRVLPPLDQDNGEGIVKIVRAIGKVQVGGHVGGMLSQTRKTLRRSSTRRAA